MSASASAPIAVAPREEREPDRRPLRWTLCKRLFAYSWKHPALQSLIALQAPFVALLNASVPFLMTETIRRAIESPPPSAPPAAASPGFHLALGASLIAAISILYHFLMRSRINAVSRLTERVVYDMQGELFAHIQRLDMAFFDGARLGRILSRGTSDINAIRAAIAQVIPRTLIQSLIMLFMLAAMIAYDWLLALMLLAFAPLVIWLNRFFSHHIQDAYRAVQESFSRLTATIAETIAGIRVTQAFAREDANARQFQALLLAHRANNLRAAHIHGLYLPVLELSSQSVAVAIFTLGAWRITGGAMTVADLIGFLLYSGGFFAAATALADLYTTTLRAMAGAERFFALLDTNPTILDNPSAIPLPPNPHRLGARVEFRSVSFGYRPDRPVLHDISFAAEPGQTIALVGHTGSGKSTLINLVSRLYDRQRGLILLDAHPIESLTLHSLRAQMAIVSQDNFLFDGSVLDNLRFANPDASRRQAEEACDSLGCLDLLAALPEGLDTPVGERGASLSLGQRQLVCFARAMLADPRLLILDEATAAVDTFTEHRLQQALDRLVTGRTSLVVAHRLSTIRRADTILVLDRGRIIERGSHAQLLAARGAYTNLHNQFVRLIEGAPPADHHNLRA